MKKLIWKNRFLIFILIVSFFPVFYIFFHPFLWHTHDGLMHLARIGAWVKSIKDGQFPPRWAGDLNYGYGSPVLIFMYFWPYFLASVLVLGGLSLTWSFKIVSVMGYVLAGITMFLFCQNLFRNKKKALLISILYQFSSFHLTEIIIRGAVGELWTYVFFPISLLGIYKILEGGIKEGLIFSTVGTSLLILSHNSISLSFFACLPIFIIIFGDRKKTRNILIAIFSLFLALGVSSFYWFPALWERKYTYGDLFMKDLYKENFPSLYQIFIPNFLNQKWGWVSNIPVQIGAFHLIPFLLIFFLFLRGELNAKEKRIFIFSLVIFIASIFIMLPLSAYFWEKISLLRQFQFSWRLLSLITFSTSITGFVFLKSSLLKNRKLFWFFCFFIIFSSFPYWKPQEGFDKIDEDYWWNYPLNTTYFGEANTIWAGNPPEKFPFQRIEIIEGKGKINNFFKKSIYQRFSINAETEVNVVSRTLFFPGWRVFVDKKEVPIEFQDPNYRGLITFRVPQGEHDVEIRFTRTKDRIIGEFFSLTSFLIFLLIPAII
jgi:uncharacterized membrane protein